ncbi:Polycystin-2 [Amphibalanus amphitrite]|uniref:Polycystin-2 n=2 Tax=Amphibalanus amphitrite TaxID=1232801 RepID=A0A6A4WAG1_AMPAM|nr:Polycystin-2 [Amphibalanus amphitrite]
MCVNNYNRPTKSCARNISIFNTVIYFGNFIFPYRSEDKISLPRHFYAWLRSTYVSSVFWEEHYNGDRLAPADRPFMADMVTLRLGPARIRQVRIQPDQCSVPNIMRNLHDECNVEYSWTKEDKQPYNVSWVPVNVTSKEQLDKMQSPWVYKSMMDLDGAPHWGLLNTYNGGGYHADLLGSGAQTERLFAELERHGWIDKFTRAVFIEFTVVNTYVNLFSRVSLVVEFSNSGNTFNSYTITTFQLFNYVGPDAIWIMVCEAIVVLFVLYFLVTEIKKLRKQKMAYFSEFWNTLEFIKLILAITSIAMYAMKNIYVHVALGNLFEKQGEFINMQRMAAWNETFVFLIAFVCFVSILEVMHLLRFNANMSMLALTLKRSTKELVYFSVTFCITFLAFAQFAFLAFGTSMNLYNNFMFTVENLCTHLLGDIDFETMYETHGGLGVCFYLAFVLIMTFIVLNMFLAILGDSFTDVKQELKEARNQYELLDFCKGIVMDMLGMRRRPAAGLDPTLPAVPEDDAGTDGPREERPPGPREARSAKVAPSPVTGEAYVPSTAPSFLAVGVPAAADYLPEGAAGGADPPGAADLTPVHRLGGAPDDSQAADHGPAREVSATVRGSPAPAEDADGPAVRAPVEVRVHSPPPEHPADPPEGEEAPPEAAAGAESRPEAAEGAEGGAATAVVAEGAEDVDTEAAVDGTTDGSAEAATAAADAEDGHARLGRLSARSQQLLRQIWHIPTARSE